MKTYNNKKIFYAGGYPAIYVNGKVTRIHILEMEQKLGRKLKKEECIHHKDENKNNYHIDNLICFATNADHICFHQGGEIWFDNEGIAHCIKKTVLVNSNHTRYKICPYCGGLMSMSAKKCCKKCYSHSDIKPTINNLQYDLQTLGSLEAVGKKYSVSGNAVKKWCKSYNIYQSQKHDLPHKQNFIKFISTHSITEASLHYDVSRDVIQRWIKQLNIHIEPQKIMCVETGIIFDSALDIGRKMFPEKSVKSVGNMIGKALKDGSKQLGYHWKYNPRRIT